MAVITISRQLGSGGDEIAEQACSALGYHLFDKRLIFQAASEVGLSEQEAIDYSEDNHKVQSFLDRLFGRPALSQMRQRKEPIAGGGVVNGRLEDVKFSEEAALALVQKAIRSAYKVGNIIIIGRGGQQILKYYPAVLHVRVEAPLEDRVQRVKEQFRLMHKELHTDIELRRAAQSWILERDAASADYIKRFYNVDWTDTQLYHLAINMGKVKIDQAVDIIARLARELDATPSGGNKLPV